MIWRIMRLRRNRRYWSRKRRATTSQKMKKMVNYEWMIFGFLFWYLVIRFLCIASRRISKNYSYVYPFLDKIQRLGWNSLAYEASSMLLLVRKKAPFASSEWHFDPLIDTGMLELGTCFLKLLRAFACCGFVVLASAQNGNITFHSLSFVCIKCPRSSATQKSSPLK